MRDFPGIMVFYADFEVLSKPNIKVVCGLAL
jgi:hypothetical protein